MPPEIAGPGLSHLFEPHIQRYIECLLSQKDCRINLTSDSIKIVDPCSGCLTGGGNERCRSDRFKLKIPYAQQILTWEVIFDSANPKEPPDFIFDAEDFDFQPSLEELNGLVCWDWHNRESLLAVVTELLEHYKHYQLERAGNDANLQRHLRSLLVENPHDLQVFVNRTERGLGTLNALMRIEANFSHLPPYMSHENPGEEASILHMRMPNAERSGLQAQLYLSPSVERALGGSINMRIPTFQPGMLMGEYFSQVKQLLHNQVKLVTEGFERRKDYIAAFLSHFGKSVLEYDAQSFSMIVLLLEWNDFFFTFTVDLPTHFPAEHPVYTFKSVYHNQNKKPYTERYTEFPYSPRWNGNEMAKRANAFILETIKEFQKSSVTHADK